MPLHHRQNNINERSDNKFSQLLSPGLSASTTDQCHMLVRSTCHDEENSENWKCRIQELLIKLQRPVIDDTISGRQRIEEDLVDAWLSGFLVRVSTVEDNSNDFMDSAHDSIELAKRRRQTFSRRKKRIQFV